MEIQNRVRESAVWESTNCCVCNRHDYRKLFETADMLHPHGERFQVVRCNGCGHTYINPRPNLQLIRTFYQSDYGPHREAASFAEAEFDRATDHRRLSIRAIQGLRRIPGLRTVYTWLVDSASDFIPELNRKSPAALEVGCGAGGFLERLVAKGWQAQGLEPSEAPAQNCRDRGLMVTTGDLESATLPENTYDVVFAWMVLEHVHQPAKALEKIAHCLRPDGIFLMSIPHYGSWEARLFGRYWYGIELVHLNYFTLAELRQLLASAGMTIERVYYQSNVRNIIGSLGILIRESLGFERLGNGLIQYAGDMSMWSQLGWAPLAKILSWMHQSGRITVQARKTEAVHS